MSTTVPTVTTAEALAAEVENSQRRGGGPDRGRGEEQDRGRGRGRRRGRPPIYDSPRNQISLDPNATGETTAPPAVVKKKTPRPPLTHFLSIPIGHHADLRQRISAFTTALLASDPAIPGLDETIIISPRRLHLTLGVMSLDLEGPGPDPGPDPAPSAEGSSNNSNLRPKTLESATQLLNELKPKVTELLVGQKLRVGLKRINIMKPEHGDPDRAHVLWAGPDYNDEDARRLNAISTFVHKEFRKAGLVVDDKRPLKLHSTLVNTIYRKPRGRKPFSLQMPSLLPSLRIRK
ncbi:unnamed protein product [Somion occarium]|uniref:A-kinase anchor protein 7-like phosphoesterase domain-containing protein n=1 Tax=Somion occarium TaxID=3059160 RepID=A0ABP1E1J1_9APHY